MQNQSFEGLDSLTWLKVFVGSACGLGLLPYAPGTFGALLGVIGHLAIFRYVSVEFRYLILILFFIIVCLAHFLLTPWAVRYWRSSDPSNFVLDEVAGYLFVPILFRHGRLWQVALWGFILFRILDIIKIPPARQIDRKMHGAWGILLDDLVSALYAVMILYIMMIAGRGSGLSRWLITS